MSAVIASEAKQSSVSREALDCFVAVLLAMTPVSPIYESLYELGIEAGQDET